MRILIATVYENIGGSTKVLLAAAEALRREHTVVVRAPIPQADSRPSRMAPQQSLEGWRKQLTALPGLLGIALSELVWLARHRPQVLYVHDELSLYVYGPAAALLRIPLVWHVHRQEGAGRVRRLREALCRAKIFVADFLVGPGQSRPWTRIRNPVAPCGPVQRAASPVLRVGMIGSVSGNKNQALGIEILERIRGRGRPATLSIFGDTLDPAYARMLRATIAARGLEDVVTLRGFVPLERALSEIDVLLSCSAYESFGLATVEALASGIPAVVIDIAAHREIGAILQTEALVLTPADATAMADALVAARPDPAVAQRIETAFGADRFADEVRAFFSGVVSPQAGAPRLP